MQSLISRIISPFIVAFVAWLASKGIDLGADAESFIASGTAIVVAAFVALYGVVHKLIDRKINPTDNATK